MQDRQAARVFGIAALAAVLITGISTMLDFAGHNEIETLTLCERGRVYCMTKFPGTDIDCVEQHLRAHQITSVWSTLSFTYPLLFESGEKLAISDSVFGWQHNLLPPSVAQPEPGRDQPAVCVIESNSPIRPALEDHLTEDGPPLINECGMLVVIEQR